ICVPGGVLLDADDLRGLGRGGDDPAEVDADGGQVAVEQDQWAVAAAAVDLVVHLEAVHRGVAVAVAGPDGGLGHGTGSSSLARVDRRFNAPFYIRNPVSTT